MKFPAPRCLLVLVFAASLVGFSSKNPPPPPRPNILLILADDLGYGDLSAYGATDLRTPHVDSLLAAGTRFTNFYANSPVCSPSRAALLTGRYPEQVGVPGVIRDEVRDSWGYLSPSATLLPTYLRKAGYHTALVGKWHLGLESPNLPNERGFHHFYGLLEGMMDDYVAKRRHGQNFLRENNRVIDPTGHATDLFTDAAIRYLDGRRNATSPFFLYLAYTAPHDPLQPPAEFLRRVFQRQPGIDSTRARLVALIEHLDAGIGRVLAALRKNGQDHNTLVVFLSDNGGWGPGKPNVGGYRGFKGSMYEGGLRIPAGATWPGRIAPGRTLTGTWQLMDWFPTLLDAAGTKPPAGLDGRSFWPVLVGGEDRAPTDRPLFFVRREGQDRFKGLAVHALRLGDYKLLQPDPFSPYELYNLNADPRETTNLTGTEKAKRDELVNLLMEHIRRGGSVPWQKPAR
jgi:arylsulfatase A-like enzyme